MRRSELLEAIYRDVVPVRDTGVHQAEERTRGSTGLPFRSAEHATDGSDVRLDDAGQRIDVERLAHGAPAVFRP